MPIDEDITRKKTSTAFQFPTLMAEPPTSLSSPLVPKENHLPEPPFLQTPDDLLEEICVRLATMSIRQRMLLLAIAFRQVAFS